MNEHNTLVEDPVFMGDDEMALILGDVQALKSADHEPQTPQSSPQAAPPPPPSLTGKTSLKDLVEDTFAAHFSENGERVVDMLSKVDPGAYIKHVTGLLPKQVAVREDVHSTHDVNVVSREVRYLINDLTGREEKEVPPYQALPPVGGKPEVPALEDWL